METSTFCICFLWSLAALCKFNISSVSVCCFSLFILTNKSHPCLRDGGGGGGGVCCESVFTLSVVGMGVMLRYAGVSVCYTRMVWSPCGQMPWVWGDTKGFHWRRWQVSWVMWLQSRRMHPGKHSTIWHHSISRTALGIMYTCDEFYQILPHTVMLCCWNNQFCYTDDGLTCLTVYICLFLNNVIQYQLSVTSKLHQTKTFGI